MNKQTQPPVLWCFRRWSRKPWAAFAGMCRFKYGHLSVAMSIILLATQFAGAQTVGTDSLSGLRTRHLAPVIVSTRHFGADRVELSPVSQTRFLVEQKGKAPLGSAEALLRLVPSVDIRERGGKSTQADIAIRGGSFDQSMVMLNGIDFSDPRTGHQSIALPVDLDIVSDIAILDGEIRPGALSGAADFRTAETLPYLLRVRLEGGEWGYGYSNLSGGFSEGGLNVTGAASYKRSDGYRYNTDFWNLNAYTRVVYASQKAGRFDAQGGFQRREWGSNGFYSLAYPDQFESTLTGLASLRWTKRWGRFGLEATGSFRQNNDLFEMERDDPSNIPFNYHTSYGVGGSLEAHYDWRAGQTSLGADYIHHTMFSTAMGETLTDPSHKIPGEKGFYPKRARRDVTSAWLEHRKDWAYTWIEGRAALDRTPYGTDATFGTQAGWIVNEAFSFKADVVRSMRLPTFTDLFYNVATYHPDPDLKPETAMTYRFTAALIPPKRAARTESWSMEASVWYRDTKSVIDWEQRPDMNPDDGVDKTGHWWSTQLNRLGTIGAELSANYTTKGWLRTAMLNYGYIHSDKNISTAYISKYALDYMRHKLSAAVGVAFLRDFTFTLTGSLYDRTGSYIDAGGIQRGYDPYFLLDGRLAWESSVKGRAGLEIYLDATNITGTRWFDYGGLPMPRTWISGGIAVTIR